MLEHRFILWIFLTFYTQVLRPICIQTSLETIFTLFFQGETLFFTPPPPVPDTDFHRLARRRALCARRGRTAVDMTFSCPMGELT